MAGNDEKHLTPVWIVYVDGKRLDTEHEGALQKIHMDDVLDGAGACTLEFDTSAVRIAESGTFSLESVVSVHMGYKDDCEQVFSGEVTDFQIKCNEYGNEQLFVTCHNCLHKMQNSHKAESFESKRLSDILRGIVDAYSLKSEIEDFGATKDYQAEISTTDFDFLLESARKYGKTVYAYESTVYVKNEVTVRDDDIILEWGKSLISFTADERLKGQISECTLTGWDADACKPISGSASLKEIPVKIGGSKSWEDNSNGAGGKWSSVFVESDLYDNDDAKARAIGKLVESSFSYQTGVAKCEGDYRIHPGMRVNIKYVGKRFSGEYIADRVEHDLSVGGAFITTVHVKRNFCETSIHKEASAIDSERASNQSANTQEENDVPVPMSESQVEEQNNSEVTSAVENNTQTSSGENSQADNRNPIVSENDEEILYDFGKIAAAYRDWKQQNDEWKNEKLSNAAGDTMEKHGYKVVSAARLVCTIAKNNKFTPNRFTNKKDKIVDGNGDLSQSAIMGAIKKANPNIVVKSDYFEKQLNESTLKNLKKDSKYIHYILGRAYIGGGLGQHWVNIEDYTVLGNGGIEYKIVPSSKNDAGRIFRSDSSFATDTKKAYINKIEVYSVERKGN